MSKFKTWLIGFFVGIVALLGLSRVGKNDIVPIDKEEDDEKAKQHEANKKAIEEFEEDIKEVKEKKKESRNDSDQEREDRWNS